MYVETQNLAIIGICVQSNRSMYFLCGNAKTPNQKMCMLVLGVFLFAYAESENLANMQKWSFCDRTLSDTLNMDEILPGMSCISKPVCGGAVA